MPNIEIDVVNKVASVNGYPTIVLGNDDYSLTFNFDSEWSGYTSKTLVLSMLSSKTGMIHTHEIMFQGSTVNLPAVFDTGEVNIGVSAGDIKTTTNAIITCYGTINTDNNPHLEPTPQSIYQQLLAYLAGLQGGGAAAGLTILQLYGEAADAAGVTTIIEEGTA